MPLRDEFQQLDEKCTKLRRGKELSQEFLKDVRAHIELCEHLARTDQERAVITRTAYWWRKKATRFGLDMKQPKLLPAAAKTPEEIEAYDRKFLRSLDIAPFSSDEDDGA